MPANWKPFAKLSNRPGLNTLLIPLAFEWIALITLIAPLVLVGRFRQRPTLGLIVWFSSFLSAGLATLVLIFNLAVSILETWLKLHSNPNGTEIWWQAVLAGFGPWLFLAVAGVSLALMNLKIAPLIDAGREIAPLAKLASSSVMTYQGCDVRLVEIPIDHAFTDGRDIFVSRQLWQSAGEAERGEILRHELKHIRQRHPQLKRVVQLIYAITPKFAASNAFASEVNALTEIIASRP